jgi:uncharacterized membrane protein YraQ (UPF0718 family)
LGPVLEKIWEGLEQSFLMAYEVWWALVIGFAISGIVQAWVPRARIQSALSGTGFGPIARATGLGAASSSCSYAAIAIARSLFAKGASAITTLAFQFASTNLVWELGLVLWVLMGWQFTLAEFVGGIVMIALMAVMLRRFVSPALEARARVHAEEAAGESTGGCGHDQSGHDHAEHDDGSHAEHDQGDSHDHHDHGAPGPERPLRESIRSADAWREVAGNFRMDWAMLWKEIAIGFLLAGFIGLLGDDFFNVLFITDAPPLLRTLENVIVGPLIAVLSFVCSVGNVPLAAVLWSGGIGFGGVVAFLFADLIVIPIVLAYRKYYGNAFAFRITALMLVTIILAALIVDGVFGVVGLVPTGPRPTRTDVFGSIGLNYKLVLNVIATAIFLALVWLSRSGSGDEAGIDIVDEQGQQQREPDPRGV